MKYTTKNKKDLENHLVLHVRAFDKAEGNADASHDAVHTGRRRIQSMCCSLVNVHESAAPMASLYLLHEAGFYASSRFTKVYVNAFVSALFATHGDMDVILHEDSNGGRYKPSSSYLNYVYRPPQLNDLNEMESVRK